jgi:hypothetical protein
MAKGKGATKQVKTTANKVKARRQPQKSSGDHSKKGIHCQKRPASDGSDSESSEADLEGPRARRRKKTRRVDANRKECVEDVEVNDDEDEVEHVGDRDDDSESEDTGQVSSSHRNIKG